MESTLPLPQDPAVTGPAIVADAAYPRPQLRRDAWTSLDGPWRFRYDDDRRIAGPDGVAAWTHTIEVPFAPETPRSGVGDPAFHPVCWYERTFEAPGGNGGHVLVHFGAVDYAARVWVNGQFVGGHEGGHTPFTLDVTDALTSDGPQRLTVRAEDDPHDLAKPRGKQDWQEHPHSIWYPRTTGIWQTVWVERVPETFVASVRWTPHLERWEIGVEIALGGHHVDADDLDIRLRLHVGGRTLARDTYSVVRGEVHRRVALADPGIDDVRAELLWSPERPTLIEADIELWRDAERLDAVHSYTALRSVAVQADQFLLNGRPYLLRLVLDQGYWPDSFMTAPDDGAHRRDVELAKAMGFNGVRKHQKIEDPRYLFWADVLGLMVWEEMPSPYRFTPLAVTRMTREWTEAIERDVSHPCIVAWVPFNESWGVPDLAETAAHRNAVRALYHLTKTLDPTRPVIGNDGWETAATDILAVHDYDNEPARFTERYGPGVTVADLLAGWLPAGRRVAVDGFAHTAQPLMLTEFGGIALAPGVDGAWGYATARDAHDLHAKYAALLAAVHRSRLFRGFCYTQFTDTFQEANGLLYADRTPKVPLALLAAATQGRFEAAMPGVEVASPGDSGDGAGR